MSDYTHLIGAEDVANAGRSMRDAANTISSAAMTMQEAMDRLSQRMEDHASRLEQAMKAPAAAIFDRHLFDCSFNGRRIQGDDSAQEVANFDHLDLKPGPVMNRRHEPGDFGTVPFDTYQRDMDAMEKRAQAAESESERWHGIAMDAGAIWHNDTHRASYPLKDRLAAIDAAKAGDPECPVVHVECPCPSPAGDAIFALSKWGRQGWDAAAARYVEWQNMLELNGQAMEQIRQARAEGEKAERERIITGLCNTLSRGGFPLIAVCYPGNATATEKEIRDALAPVKDEVKP